MLANAGREGRAARESTRGCQHGRFQLQHLRRVAMLALAVLAIAALFALPGCKYSDVLTQHTEDPAQGALDENADPTYKSNPDAEERPDLDDVSVSASDDQNTQVAVLPHYDPNADDNGPTLRRVKSTETPHDEEASEGDQEGDADRSGAGTEDSDQGGKDTSNNEGEDEGEGDNETENLEDDPLENLQSDEQSLPEDGGGSGETVVVDPEGVEDETEKGTVAAVGEYATITQMLGGAGALTVCDQAWLDARGSDGAFDGELEKVVAGFSGDGTQPGSLDLESVKTASPSVVLWDSASNVPALSDDDQAALSEAGITVQPVPHIGEQTTEDEDVKLAVAAVASVLQGADGLQFDPADVLSQYNSFHDEVLTGCYDANGGYSYKVCDSQYIQLYQDSPLAGLDSSTTNRVVTVFVDSLWHPSMTSAEVSQSASYSTGTISLVNDGKTLDLSDGVCLSAKTSASAYMLVDYYLQLAGAMNNAYDTDMPASQNKPYILMPGEAAAFGRSGNYASRVSGTAMFFNAGDGSVQANWHALGDADFQTVLTADEEVADAVLASAKKSDGLYHMENSYRVIVVPSGIAGSWAQGHLDSFLLAPWAFRIQDEDNLDAAVDYASAFYTKFLRCSTWNEAVTNWDNARET